MIRLKTVRTKGDQIFRKILCRGGQGQKSGQVTKTLQCVTKMNQRLWEPSDS